MLARCLSQAKPIRSLRFLSTKSMASVYVVPIDPKAPKSSVDGVDAAQLWSLTPQGDKPAKASTTRTFYGTPSAGLTTLASVGPDFDTAAPNAKREIIRKAVGTAVKEVRSLDGVKEVVVDASLDPHAAGKF